jgi:hypothetical protein
MREDARGWYDAHGQERLGPVELYQIGDLVHRGEIGAATLVWTPGLEARNSALAALVAIVAQNMRVARRTS